MAEAKFRPTGQSVDRIIEQVPDEQTRDDCYELIRMMTKITGADPVVWYPNIIGFGKCHYVYDSGHEGEGSLAAFAIRKPNLNVYVLDFPERDDLLKKLGKHKVTKGCIYIRKLADVDIGVLEKIITKSVAFIRKKYPE